MDIDQIINETNELDDYQKTNYLIDFLKENTNFNLFAQNESKKIKRRDYEDSQLLKKGIEIALQNGLKKNNKEKNWIPVNVDNKTPNEVVKGINCIVQLQPGMILAISGNSGVGKGTIVKTIQSGNNNCLIWSNGDLFRSITYLSRQMYPELIKDKKYNLIPYEDITKSIQISNGGVISIFDKDKLTDINEIKITKLKNRDIENILPEIAMNSQKIVIEKVNALFERNTKLIILLEGRKETLNLIQSDFQIELSTSEENIIGKRRAAQKIMAKLYDSNNQILVLDDIINELNIERNV
ncbi:MAG: hypothetical protein GY756_05180 [bacterium]|nr:hypothetical protein [bacterium]